MSVTLDTHAIAATVFSATSITTPSLTVGSGLDRAAALGLGFFANVTAVTASLGGVSAALVTGTDQFNNGKAAMVMAVIAPPSGSQTATASWATATTAEMTVVTVTGADQTAPMNNGVQATTTFAFNLSLSVTGNVGDLTTTSCVFGNSGQTSDQVAQNVGTLLGSDISAGTGTTIHTWSNPTQGSMVISGANFVASGTPEPEQVYPFALTQRVG